jgi:predicted PurR-regulated permease PerM
VDSEERHRHVPALLDSAAAYSWRFLVIAAAIAVVGFAMSRLMSVVVAFVVALLIARALTPLIGWLSRHGVRRLAATWIAFLLAVGVIAGLVLLFLPSAVEQFKELDEAVIQGVRDVQDWLVEGPLGLSQTQVERGVDRLIEEVQANASRLASGALARASTAIEFLVGGVLALVLSFFFSRDGARMWSFFSGAGGRGHRQDFYLAGRRAWDVLGGYLLGAVVEGAVEGSLVGLSLWILGVPLAFPLALLIFFGAFFPVIGPFVAGLVAALVALVSGGVAEGLIVVGIVVVVNQLVGNLLMPYVMGKTLDIHPAVVLVSITVGGLLAGIAGAFLAVPVVGIVIRVSQELHDRYTSNGGSADRRGAATGRRGRSADTLNGRGCVAGRQPVGLRRRPATGRAVSQSVRQPRQSALRDDDGAPPAF